MADDIDPEREYRKRTGKVLKRRDPCANNQRTGAAEDCPKLAMENRSYCSIDCSNQAWARDREKYVGGSIDRHADEHEHRTRYEAEPVSGTRHPRELP